MRSISFRWAILLLIAIVPSIVLQAVSTEKSASRPSGSRRFTYRTFLRGARKGVPAASFEFESLSSSNQFVLDRGTLSFVGGILPPPPRSATFFPTKIQVSMVHLSEKRTLLSRQTFDLTVQSDGRILHQTFPFPTNLIIHPKESLICSVVPMDAALPACILNLTAGLIPESAPDSPLPGTVADPPFPRPGILEAAFSFSRAITFQAKGRETFHFKLGIPGRKGLSWPPGFISVSGNFVSPAAVPFPIPNNVEMIIRHVNSSGKILSVDSDVIQISPSGNIPLQKFALSTIGPNRTPEDLEISFVPLDSAVPAGVLDMRFAYTR